jgi:hypothetical protein
MLGVHNNAVEHLIYSVFSNLQISFTQEQEWHRRQARTCALNFKLEEISEAAAPFAQIASRSRGKVILA